MALLNSNFGNLMLGLASYKRPDMLNSVVKMQQEQYNRARQEEEDKRRREMEDYKFSLLKQQQDAQNRAAGLIGMEQRPGVTLPQEQVNRQLAQSLAQMGDINGAISLLQPEGKDGFTLGPNQARFDAQGRIIASLPGEENNNLMTVGGLLFDKSKNQYIIPENTPPNFSDERAFSKEFKANVKPIEIAVNSAKNINALLSGSGPYRDVASLISAVKILDPESVVREGEVGIVTSAQGIWDRIQGTLTKAKGEGFLTDDLKRDMRESLAEIMDVYKDYYESTYTQYEQSAMDYKMAPDRVLGKRLDFPALRERRDPPGKIIRVIEP